MSNANENVTSLSTMLGSGVDVEIKGKKYTIKPIILKDIEDFFETFWKKMKPDYYESN